ncbi:MAG TPA: hypothetical protein VIR56_09445 [Solimonas sp.]
MNARGPLPLRTLVLVLVGCLVLLAANIGAAFLPIGSWHAPVSIALGLSEAALLLSWWMELRYSGTLLRIAVLLPAAWLVLLITLIALDDATRVHLPPLP